MAAATRAEALSAQVAARDIEEAYEAADRRRASAWGVLGVSAEVVVVWLAVGAVAPVRELLIGWWVLHAAWALTVRARARVSARRHLELGTELVAACATVGAASAGPVLVNVVWLIPFARAVTWLPRRPARVDAARWFLVVAHLAVTVQLAHAGQLPGAAVVVAILLGQVLVLNVSTQLMQQRLELDAEARALHGELERSALHREHDRIARELHDGLGADLVALMLALRARGPAVEAYTQQVLTLLEELRSVVWAIRGGRGSLAEFEKLVRAKARITLPATTIVTTMPPLQRGQVVEPHATLTMLEALQAVLEGAGAPARLEVRLENDPSLAVTLRFTDSAVPDVLPRVTRSVSVTATSSEIRLEVR